MLEDGLPCDLSTCALRHAKLLRSTLQGMDPKEVKQRNGTFDGFLSSLTSECIRSDIDICADVRSADSLNQGVVRHVIVLMSSSVRESLRKINHVCCEVLRLESLAVS